MAGISLIPSPLTPFLSHSKTLKGCSSLNFKSTKTLARRTVSFSYQSPEIPQEVQTFWRWLGDGSLVSAKNSVAPGVFPEGIGLVAKRDIARNEVLFEVPKRFWINPDMVAASDIGPVCSGLKPWVSIALFLIRERFRDDSAWRIYLDILPDCTDSTLFWSEEELAELKGTQLLSTTLGVRDFVESEFIRVQGEVLVPNRHFFQSTISLEDFLWAFGILRSRAFSRLQGQNLVLIPLADLINHGSSIGMEDTAWEIRGAGLFSRDLIFSLRAPVSFKAGEQVLVQYDMNKSNAEMALDYGFVESNSDRNAYTLTLEIQESDPFFEDKLDIAETNGFGETAYFDIIQNQSLPPGMLQYLRMVALADTDAFLLESIFRNTVWSHLEMPVSRANEELICSVVRDACQSALSGYQTSIEEDERILEEGKLKQRMEIAVQVRAGEKRVLQQIDRIFEDRQAELDTLEYYQERRLKDLGLVGEQGEIIFWETK